MQIHLAKGVFCARGSLLSLGRGARHEGHGMAGDDHFGVQCAESRLENVPSQFFLKGIRGAGEPRV